MNSALFCQSNPICPFLQDVATIYTHLDDQFIKEVFSLGKNTEGVLRAETDLGSAHFEFHRDRWAIVSDEKAVLLSSDIPIVPKRGSLLPSMQNPCQCHAWIDNTETERMYDTLVAAIQTREELIPTYLLYANVLIDRETGTEVSLPPNTKGRCLTLTVGGDLFVGTNQGLLAYRAGRLQHVLISGDEIQHKNCEDIRGMAADSIGIWLATGGGLFYYTPTRTQYITSLPINCVRGLVLACDNALWMATEAGVCRFFEGRWRVYAGKRWLASDDVRDILVTPEGSAWIATAGGISRIDSIPMTLHFKAIHHLDLTTARHNRDGFVAECRLRSAGDLTDPLLEATDNDGLWTALYICAESFRHAVTGEPDARENAWRSMQALLRLVKITGVPGYPARALVRANERVHRSEPASNWYPSRWRQEASSRATHPPMNWTGTIWPGMSSLNWRLPPRNGRRWLRFAVP